jgi:hypothetical protein
LQFRTEFFNSLNKTTFSPATITSAFPDRQAQFALDLI